MPLLGQAVIAIWNDITLEGRANFNEWHPRQHMPERVGIPGFRRGRRYIGTDARIEFFTFYEADTLEVLTGPDYKARLNAPTEWSTRSVADFRNNLRGVCRVAFTAGHADGAHLATIRFDVKDGADDALRSALSDKLLPPLVSRPEVVGAHLCIVDKTLSGTNTSLQRTRTIGVPSWIVLIEGASAAAVRAATDTLLAADLPGRGAMPEIIDEMYLLEYGLTKQPGAR
jgi:hypothetical protein